MNWEKLQNGSDIRGIAVEGVKGEAVNLTAKVATILGESFVIWLSKYNKNISIAIGCDSRISGDDLKQAFMTGASNSGANMLDCDMASTPAMFMSTILGTSPATAGVMITASHLPYNRNGFKFFTKNGGLDKKDITEILKIASNLKETDQVLHHSFIKKWNLIDEYSDFLVAYIRNTANNTKNYEKPLEGLKIIVDAGNGAGGFFVAKVLNRLGADTNGSQFLAPDGHFPNHIPNPEDEAAMQSICQAVIANKADLGVIFDTDVDRSAIVDSKGNPVNRNALIALISSVILAEHPNSTIVTDSITSDALSTFIEHDLKGKHHRFKRGYKNVINESIRLNNSDIESWLAIETSGHTALKENYFLDDGAYLIAKLLAKAAQLNLKGQSISSLISNFKHPHKSKEFRFSISENNFANYGQMVLSELTKEVEKNQNWEIVQPNFEGIRVKCNAENENGWFLLRLSLHDPVMPLNIESDIENGVETIAKNLKQLLKDFNGLNIDALP